VKEAQPNLDVRFAKHLLARTSIRVLPGDLSIVGGGDGVTPGSAWQTNAAGFTFNHNFGFGLINAQALVEQAVLYEGVTPLQTYSSGTMNVNQALPDSNLTGVTRSTDVNVSGLLEEVLITLDITHTGRGDIEAFLTSPMGTTSRIVYRNEPDGGDNIVSWEFTSNAFWGEDPFGTWSLMVRDVFFPEDLGTWNSWAIDLNMGTLVVPEPAGAMICVAGGLLFLRRRRCGAGPESR
jgi:subtilisin-like proprotein convertase family protein